MNGLIHLNLQSWIKELFQIIYSKAVKKFEI